MIARDENWDNKFVTSRDTIYDVDIVSSSHVGDEDGKLRSYSEFQYKKGNFNDALYKDNGGNNYERIKRDIDVLSLFTNGSESATLQEKSLQSFNSSLSLKNHSISKGCIGIECHGKIKEIYKKVRFLADKITSLENFVSEGQKGKGLQDVQFENLLQNGSEDRENYLNGTFELEKSNNNNSNNNNNNLETFVESTRGKEESSTVPINYAVSLESNKQIILNTSEDPEIFSSNHKTETVTKSSSYESENNIENSNGTATTMDSFSEHKKLSNNLSNEVFVTDTLILSSTDHVANFHFTDNKETKSEMKVTEKTFDKTTDSYLTDAIKNQTLKNNIVNDISSPYSTINEHADNSIKQVETIFNSKEIHSSDEITKKYLQIGNDVTSAVIIEDDQSKISSTPESKNYLKEKIHYSLDTNNSEISTFTASLGLVALESQNLSSEQISNNVSYIERNDVNNIPLPTGMLSQTENTDYDIGPINEGLTSLSHATGMTSSLDVVNSFIGTTLTEEIVHSSTKKENSGNVPLNTAIYSYQETTDYDINAMNEEIIQSSSNVITERTNLNNTLFPTIRMDHDTDAVEIYSSSNKLTGTTEGKDNKNSPMQSRKYYNYFTTQPITNLKVKALTPNSNLMNGKTNNSQSTEYVDQTVEVLETSTEYEEIETSGNEENQTSEINSIDESSINFGKEKNMTDKKSGLFISENNKNNNEIEGGEAEESPSVLNTQTTLQNYNTVEEFRERPPPLSSLSQEINSKFDSAVVTNDSSVAKYSNTSTNDITEFFSENITLPKIGMNSTNGSKNLLKEYYDRVNQSMYRASQGDSGMNLDNNSELGKTKYNYRYGVDFVFPTQVDQLKSPKKKVTSTSASQTSLHPFIENNKDSYLHTEYGNTAVGESRRDIQEISYPPAVLVPPYWIPYPMCFFRMPFTQYIPGNSVLSRGSQTYSSNDPTLFQNNYRRDFAGKLLPNLHLPFREQRYSPTGPGGEYVYPGLLTYYSVPSGVRPGHQNIVACLPVMTPVLAQPPPLSYGTQQISESRKASHFTDINGNNKELLLDENYEDFPFLNNKAGKVNLEISPTLF